MASQEEPYLGWRSRLRPDYIDEQSDEEVQRDTTFITGMGGPQVQELCSCGVGVHYSPCVDVFSGVEAFKMLYY